MWCRYRRVKALGFRLDSSRFVACVTPIIKKANLDPEVLSNYRPVCNLSFISKLNERVVCSQLQEHLAANNMYAPHQSAYRPNCSTETALLRLQNDLLCALDSKKEITLILLDLLAFDTIDHAMLIDRMRSRYNVNDTSLKWFSSYICDRVQSVAVGTNLPHTKSLQYGVPQGSVVGPSASQFTMYSAPLEDVITAHDIDKLFFTLMTHNCTVHSIPMNVSPKFANLKIVSPMLNDGSQQTNLN